MAQPAKILVDWIGGILAIGGDTYTAALLPAEANVVEIKSETTILTIDGTDAFPMRYGEQIFFEASREYIFAKDTQVAYGTVVTVV